MQFKCPQCGHTETFIATGHVEYHEALMDGHGNWLSDIECYDSHWADGRTLTCPKCDLTGLDHNFMVDDA